jgi:trans-aconitate 2-methyltransferase
MIKTAKQKQQDNVESLKNVTFLTNTIENTINETMADDRFDVVYSNAALHWIVNHEIVFPNIMKKLVKPNGVLAVQMPDTRVQPSHVLMVQAANKCGFEKEIKHVRIPRVDVDSEKYYRWMREYVSEIDIWSTEYVQQLNHVEGATHPVLDYVKATGMQPLLEALGGENAPKAKTFLELYEKLLYDAYPNTYLDKTGLRRIVLFPYKRFFLVAKNL